MSDQQLDLFEFSCWPLEALLALTISERAVSACWSWRSCPYIQANFTSARLADFHIADRDLVQQY